MSAYAEKVFDALGDPTRRAVLRRLRAGPRAVGDIARRLDVSRPAVSQHLKVLKGAGLVVAHAQGNRRLYAVAPRGLEEVRRWLDSLWSDALDAFRIAAEIAATNEGGR